MGVKHIQLNHMFDFSKINGSGRHFETQTWITITQVRFFFIIQITAIRVHLNDEHKRHDIINAHNWIQLKCNDKFAQSFTQFGWIQSYNVITHSHSPYCDNRNSLPNIICSSAGLCVCMFVCTSVSLSLCMSICLFVCVLSFCLSVDDNLFRHMIWSVSRYTSGVIIIKRRCLQCCSTNNC